MGLKFLRLLLLFTATVVFRFRRSASAAISVVTARELNSALEDVTDWEGLALQLDLPQQKVDEIAHDCQRNIPCCKRKLVLFWVRDWELKPSWEKIATALEKLGLRRQAASVRQKFAQDFQQSESDTTLTDADQQMKELKLQFETMVVLTLTALQENVPLPRVQLALAWLPLSQRYQHLHFFNERHIRLISNVNSIVEVFTLLNHWHYLSFINTVLLEHLVGKFGDRKLIQSMNEYLTGLKAFRQRTTVEEFVKLWPHVHHVKSVSNFSKLVVKLEKNPSESNLEDLEQFRLSFFRLLSVPVMLGDVKEGFVITWLVPSSAVDILRDGIHNMDRTFLQKQDVQELFVDEDCIFNCQVDPDNTGEHPSGLFLELMQGWLRLTTGLAILLVIAAVFIWVLLHWQIVRVNPRPEPDHNVHNNANRAGWWHVDASAFPDNLRRRLGGHS